MTYTFRCRCTCIEVWGAFAQAARTGNALQEVCVMCASGLPGGCGYPGEIAAQCVLLPRACARPTATHTWQDACPWQHAWQDAWRHALSPSFYRISTRPRPSVEAPALKTSHKTNGVHGHTPNLQKKGHHISLPGDLMRRCASRQQGWDASSPIPG